MCEANPSSTSDRSASPAPEDNRRAPGTSRIADPHATYVGPAVVWFIPKPRGPKLSLWATLLSWLVAIPLVVATLLWLQAENRPLWPFGHLVTSPAEIAFRYQIILLVCLSYVTLCSVPTWIRHFRLARRDGRSVERAIRDEQWDRAALLVHRYCLLMSVLWRRVPPVVGAWDTALRSRLPRHRRLYLYHRGESPSLPPDATAGFTPEVTAPPQPSPWSALALIPIAMLLYMLVIDVMQRGYPQRLVLFNAVLLIVILVGYGSHFFLALLGKSHYYRFAPGVVQFVRFGLGRRRPAIQSYDLRRSHAVLDLTSKWPGLTLLDRPDGRRTTLRLPRGPDVIEAVLRACLSTAATPPLSSEELLS